MDTDPNPESLMTRYQAGDFAAVTALVACIGPQLHRFFMAQSASRSDADDLLQETWLRIHRVRHTYRPGEPVMPWFYAMEEARADDLEVLLAPLSESQREVLRMMKVAGMSLEEVARATATSVGSVKQKVHRAYRTLRDSMNALGAKRGSSRVLR
jgi:RNA polymerase sigma-70 factor (ECF subfamily)